MDCDDAPSRGYSVRTIELSGAFVPSLAPPYPNIEDEQKKDIAILRSSLEIRDVYIDTLRAKRRSLIDRLDRKERDVEWLERRLESQKRDLDRATEELAKQRRGEPKQ
jgi:chromosome segregation ATPase